MYVSTFILCVSQHIHLLIQLILFTIGTYLSCLLYFRGEVHDDLEPFRAWFGRVGELRSLNQAPVMALTATASPTNRSAICRSLSMMDPVIIADSPDRPNIKLNCLRLKRGCNNMTSWIIDGLLNEQHLFPRHLIFCKTISDCAKVYSDLKCEGVNTSLFSMFHSKTQDIVKERIKIDMSKENGAIRVLICTNAAGMGVNFKGVHNVVHFGPPQDMDTFVQQLGRAGRDGEQSQHIILYNNQQLRNIHPEMLGYLRNEKCRRSFITSSYTIGAVQDSLNKGHDCCDICAVTCQCMSSMCPMTHPYMEYEDFTANEHMETPCRIVTPDKNHLLLTALNCYKYSLDEDKSTSVSPPLTHGFTDQVIATIMEKCPMLQSADDILDEIPVWSYDSACKIINIIHTIFDENTCIDTTLDENDNYEIY